MGPLVMATLLGQAQKAHALPLIAIHIVAPEPYILTFAFSPISGLVLETAAAAILM